VPTFFGQGEGVIQMRTSALFVAKTNIEFSKIYSVILLSTWTGERGEGLSQCLHFFGQEEVNFS